MTDCKLCTTKASRIKEIEEPVYFQCPNCDLIFIEDESILDCNEEKRRYSLHRNNRENTGYFSMFEQFIDVGVKPFMILHLRSDTLTVETFVSGKKK